MNPLNQSEYRHRFLLPLNFCHLYHIITTSCEQYKFSFFLYWYFFFGKILYWYLQVSFYFLLIYLFILLLNKLVSTNYTRWKGLSFFFFFKDEIKFPSLFCGSHWVEIIFQSSLNVLLGLDFSQFPPFLAFN